MQAIRQTQQLNKRELENAIPPSASWHVDYRDTAWIYVGGIPFDLTEGDVVTIFSQFGNPTHLNMVRDKETGKSKGFGFLKYEDQRSCDLAVDNLTGAEVLGKLLRVDHTRYKKKDDEDEETYRIDRPEAEATAEKNGKRASDTDESDNERRRRKRRKPVLEEAKMLAITEGGNRDDEDSDTRRARERHRERRHRHHHRDRIDERESDRRRPSHRVHSEKRSGDERSRSRRRQKEEDRDRSVSRDSPDTSSRPDRDQKAPRRPRARSVSTGDEDGYRDSRSGKSKYRDSR